MTYVQYGRPKQCQNNCGMEIMWDKEGGYFVNTSNQVQHDCPKWEKKQKTAATAATGAAITKEEIANIVASAITKPNEKLDMLMWIVEKVAHKVGVELNDNQAK